MIDTVLENVILNDPTYITELNFIEILNEIFSMNLMQFTYIG